MSAAENIAVLITDVPDEVRQCPECLETHTDEVDFCSSCGTELSGNQPVKLLA